jgi:23S rRNA (guanosine2251-2'-O)-methyltransferase
MSLTLRNPHSVIAALQTRPREVLELRVDAQRAGDAWSHAVALAERAGVAVSARVSGGRRPGNRQAGRGGSAEATIKPRSDVALSDLFRPSGDRGLWLALEQVQDPHNVGAIFRSAGFFGVRGIVVTSARSAPLTSTVYDVAAGGLECTPFALQSNLQRAIDVAKKAGLWVLGTSEHGERDFAEVDPDRNWLLVLGNEERGLRRLVLENCDEVCRLTPRGPVTSLNVSVAAGILIAGLTRVTA